MNTLEAFLINASTKDGHARGFDWGTAKKILEERRPAYAVAGLQEDLEYTIVTIWENGPVKYPDLDTGYLASRWATPVLIIDGEEIECWIPIADDEIDYYSKLRWPDSE